MKDLGIDSGDQKSNSLWVRLVFAAIALLTISDLIEDRLDGASFGHLILEGVIVIVCTVATAILWSKSLRFLSEQNKKLSAALDAVSSDLLQYRESTMGLYHGLSEAIANQLRAWGLSQAEQDIAFLLLKGLSFKEIAGLRNTSEKTVRQQAASIYAKSKLEGRAQLSAFFLEDLLPPLARVSENC